MRKITEINEEGDEWVMIPGDTKQQEVMRRLGGNMNESFDLKSVSNSSNVSLEGRGK
jgi:hypothetical protein